MEGIAFTIEDTESLTEVIDIWNSLVEAVDEEGWEIVDASSVLNRDPDSCYGVIDSEGLRFKAYLEEDYPIVSLDTVINILCHISENGLGGGD